MTKHILAIAGGVGGAKLVLGLTRVLPPNALTIVVNTGDDETFHGLHVSPDLDTVMYTLAGLSDQEQGWGLAGESFRTLDALGRLGADTWFRLGDIDLATHIRRTDMLRQGRTLSEATREMCASLGLAHAIVPMSDEPVRTIALTDEGELAFQDYFVRRRCEPAISGLRFEGAADASPSPGFRQALDECEAIVICPSNPLVSVGPVLAVPGVFDAIERFTGPRVAVSPIVGGEALRGPAAKMLAELGEQVSCVGVAHRYLGLVDVLVIDRADAQHVDEITHLGMRPYVTDTIMRTDEDKTRLALEMVRLIEEWPA